MHWVVEYTDEFGVWWEQLDSAVQVDVAAYVTKLEQRGPNLPFPYSSGIQGARTTHMRELRVQRRGTPIRVFYAFDPRRSAILRVGGIKSGNKQFYERMIPLADALYETHLQELNKESNDGG